MMEKKRSVGIIIFTVLVILVCSWSIIYKIMAAFFWGGGMGISLRSLIIFALNILLIYLAVQVFKLKNWARLAWIAVSIIILIWGWFYVLVLWNHPDLAYEVGLGGVVYFYPNFISIPILIFFTRRKVKEQFKKQK